MGAHLPSSPGNSVASIRVITAFYGKMLDSPRLQRHFAGVSMEGLISKQSAFIDIIATNGTSYSERDIQQAHAHLPIDDSDFDEMLVLLDMALREQRLDPEPGAAIKRAFASFRTAIVKPSGGESRVQAPAP